MKTATIERRPIWETPYHSLNLIYRSCVLWQEIDRGGILDASIRHNPLAELRRIANVSEHGFTHWQFVGDWDKRTKPQNGKIPE